MTPLKHKPQKTGLSPELIKKIEEIVLSGKDVWLTCNSQEIIAREMTIKRIRVEPQS